ncbi:MAG: ABC transporter permease subunit [Chloroflexi bacterium]|nr:ABC transporter permease subunit [Chloroflexota bacterium]
MIEIDFTSVAVITAKELRDALRNRWFVFYTLAFGGLALALSALGQPLSGRVQLSGYSRTAASLINLVLLFVPLIGLTLGALNLANDRENGTLDYLLAQPVTRAEVLLGKYLGLALTLFAMLCVGFGTAGVALALQGRAGDAGAYVLMVALDILLALAMLSLGFLVSTMAGRTAAALAGGLFLWLLLVFIGDLGIMGSAVLTRLPVDTVLGLTLINPLQLFKVASILTIQANLEVLGPAGVYATQRFGDGLLPMVVIGLLVWGVVPLGAALWLFTHQEKFRSRRSRQ